MNVGAKVVSVLGSMLVAATVAAAPALPIPLKAGTYVLDGAGATCADVPNAGTMYFDGRDVQFPHDQYSLSTVTAISPDSTTYSVDIAEAGYKVDGSPMHDVHHIKLKMKDEEHFQLIEENSKKPGDGRFHRCGPMPATR